MLKKPISDTGIGKTVVVSGGLAKSRSKQQMAAPVGKMTSSEKPSKNVSALLQTLHQELRLLNEEIARHVW